MNELPLEPLTIPSHWLCPVWRLLKSIHGVPAWIAKHGWTIYAVSMLIAILATYAASVFGIYHDSHSWPLAICALPVGLVVIFGAIFGSVFLLGYVGSGWSKLGAIISRKVADCDKSSSP